ncbi:MAG: GspE/PulE family protein [Parachlamydiales bacterium]
MEDERTLAQRFGMEICEAVPECRLPARLLEQIPYPFVKRHHCLPIREREEALLVALSDPLNTEAVEELRLLLGRPIEALYCPKELLDRAIQKAYEASEEKTSAALEGLEKEEGNGQGEAEVHDLLDQQAAQAPLVRLVHLLLTEAIQRGASDIHFEPLEHDLRVRFRIDGVLHKRLSPAKEHQAQLLARLKVMAGLDIAERRLPQDGRMKLRIGEREIDCRVSTLPVSGGERIVIRILDKGSMALKFDSLQMDEEMLGSLKEALASPEGIILVTGPTGSGKTTTLYSALSELQSDRINIMTVEDPVEYRLPGVAQIGVRPKIGLTFASGLRHILRQDPDVIMVGEIRDRETAEIAIQASLTGHFVLSTLHTNDAPSAITRLVDMGIESYLISSSIVGVLAQRLVRTLCPHCRLPEAKEGSHLGPGCPHCFQSGYKGRRALYEWMPMTPRVRSQLRKSAESTLLCKAALHDGMKTLLDMGKRLVEEGVTSHSEVIRVTKVGGG